MYLGIKKILLSMDILFAPKGEKKRGLLIFLWIAYAVTIGFLVCNHDPWQDEAYVWLIAREVDWAHIWWEAGVNQSPSLWYYILAVPAKLGVPYWSMKILLWVGACCAAGILLFRSPFSILFKVLFVFSYYIAYEHAVIARVYMLTLLLMWITCWCYPNRYQRSILYGVVIALLAHTSLYGLLGAFFLGVDFLFFREGRLTSRQLIAMGVILLAILLSVTGLVFNQMAFSYYVNFDFYFRPQKIRDMLQFTYLAPLADSYLPDRNKTILGLAPWLGLLSMALTLWLLKRWRAYSLMAFFILSSLFIAYITIFKYFWSAPRHYSFCLLFMVMVLWLGKVRYWPRKTIAESILGVLFVLAFLFGVLGTVAQGYRDTSTPFSGSRRMAEYLIEHKLDDKIFLTDDPIHMSAILPYMPKASLWDLRRLSPIRYMHMNDSTLQKPMLIEEIFKKIRKRRSVFPGEQYFISKFPIPGEKIGQCKFLYTTSGQFEIFWLYSVPAFRKDRGVVP